MKKKEIMEKLVENMENWQKVENASVVSTGKIIEKTSNPVIRLIMEIIQRDSQMHYRIQELIADSLKKKAISLTPEDMADVWSLIDKHLEIENKTIQLAKESLDALKDSKMVVQQYLLGFLLEDEEKHTHMLESLEKVKKGMYPYG
ncbi:MAG: hypothetical protein AB1656_06615 [Candidatus Omnitrophota bacterium]